MGVVIKSAEVASRKAVEAQRQPSCHFAAAPSFPSSSPTSPHRLHFFQSLQPLLPRPRGALTDQLRQSHSCRPCQAPQQRSSPWSRLALSRRPRGPTLPRLVPSWASLAFLTAQGAIASYAIFHQCDNGRSRPPLRPSLLSGVLPRIRFCPALDLRYRPLLRPLRSCPLLRHGPVFR